MNINKLRTIMFIAIGILVLCVFLRILPYIIIGGIVIYLVFKLYEFIKDKMEKTKKKQSSSYDYNHQGSIKDTSYDMDFDTSNAIEVDYKDVE